MVKYERADFPAEHDDSEVVTSIFLARYDRVYDERRDVTIIVPTDQLDKLLEIDVDGPGDLERLSDEVAKINIDPNLN